ncbi:MULTISPECIES: FadR/GntR family transcriptional regulator [unclassified Corynebacterium]|uniref:FadR/GntR family transcriptional regulator n=1 Tax=unclassified Corynebacterium TaxID=2624378 RepID=UPI0026485B4D|nr:FadR/GntR family transcriptional regulator [Corynebacterium sp.]MDN5581307.1 FadR family transcriptional regulator [Corynebacterium sp.]MDN5720768.1 FadR family transcriptional regulator [Corynebacterium sp.]MDN6325557.1 FadR family transcriptional regulator [Corynebacterium sp.]MDN6510046.1 FadR family transcriptional regulator [Corynebacterium sp.]
MTDEPAWAPVPRIRTHQMVVDAIENEILSGTLHVGDLLPAERTLSEQLQVSRAAVREAIRVLEGQGVLESNVGSGHKAGTFIAAMPSEALSRFLRLHVALSNFGLEEVVQTRTILEVESARLSAAEQDEDALAGMRAAVAEMDRPGVSREEFNDADTRFHVALAHGAGNRLFADMTQAIRESLRAPILRGFRGQGDWETVAGTLRTQHKGILAAVEAGDVDGAGELVAEHISTAYRTLLE